MENELVKVQGFLSSRTCLTAGRFISESQSVNIKYKIDETVLRICSMCHSRGNGNPELLKQNGFPLEFIPMKIGVGMTIK